MKDKRINITEVDIKRIRQAYANARCKNHIGSDISENEFIALTLSQEYTIYKLRA